MFMFSPCQALHGELEVRVFYDNVIGRQFYDSYGFVAQGEETFEPTAERIVSMTFIPTAG